MVASCSAVGCTNHRKRNPELSFFQLPHDKEIAAQWLAKMKRKDLPKKVFLCQDHFTPDCFDQSIEMRNRLLPGKILQPSYH